MKKYLLLSTLLLSSYLSYAQNVIYFDKDWKETTKEKSSYYRKLPLQKVGDLLLLKDYHHNGELQFQGYVLPQDENAYVGDGYWYDENGCDLNSVQYINKSKQKELSYYTNSGALYKKILYNDLGQKAIIILYAKDKVLATGEIGKGGYTGYFSPNRPDSEYRLNPIDEEKQDESNYSPVYMPNYDNTYYTIIYWANGKKASEEKHSGFQSEYKKYWDLDGKEIFNDLVNKDYDLSMQYYIKDGLAQQVKTKKETHYTNDIFTEVISEYNEKGEPTHITKKEDQNIVEERIYSQGKEKVLKYVDGEPFDGTFNYTLGNFNPIFTIANGRMVGEAITKDVDTDSIITRGTYIDGLPSEGTFFTKQNDAIIISTYKNKQQDGLQQVFDNYWRPELVRSYDMKNGKREGLYKTYLDQDKVLTMEFQNDLPYDGVIQQGDDLLYYTDGNLIKIDKLGDFGSITAVEFYENNVIASKIYFAFSIADDPQETYKGIFKNGEPFTGYFIGEDYIDNYPTILFYENGSLKYKYYVDILEFLKDGNEPIYSKKSTYKDGKKIDGFDYEPLGKYGLLGTNMENGKVNALELNLFAMHYFNQYVLELKEGILRINELQNGISLKASPVNNALLVELFDANNKLITSNKMNKVAEGTPNSQTNFKYENNKLVKESQSLTSIAEFEEKNGSKIETLLFMIYSYLSANESQKLEDTFKKLEESLKNLDSNNLSSLFDRQDAMNDTNLAFLTYDDKGKPYIGVQITEDKAGFKLVFYMEGKVTDTKQVQSIDEVRANVQNWYKEMEAQ